MHGRFPCFSPSLTNKKISKDKISKYKRLQIKRTESRAHDQLSWWSVLGIPSCTRRSLTFCAHTQLCFRLGRAGQRRDRARRKTKDFLPSKVSADIPEGSRAGKAQSQLLISSLQVTRLVWGRGGACYVLGSPGDLTSSFPWHRRAQGSSPLEQQWVG